MLKYFTLVFFTQVSAQLRGLLPQNDQFNTTESLLLAQNFAKLGTNLDDSACFWSLSETGCSPKDFCSYQYRFGDIILSQSCRLKPHVHRIPQQIHMAYAGKETGTGMAVSWATYQKVEKSQIWYGTSPDQLLATVNATILSYYTDDKYSLYNYHTVVENLKPLTRYYFKVGDPLTAVSEIYSFVTARPRTDRQEYDMAIYGDLGEVNSQETVQLISKLSSSLDFIWHIGDISYADNAYLDSKEFFGFFYERTYNAWMNWMAPAMTKIPYMVTVGNHEAECHSPACLFSKSKKDQLSNYTAYNTRFRMPSLESGGVKNMWYSFDHGPVHYVAISSESDYENAPSNAYTLTHNHGPFGNQLAWLRADLEKAVKNRHEAPWIIVASHRPIYSVNSCDDKGNPINEPLNLQKAIEELLLEFQVDVFIVGHHHAYERHTPIARGQAFLDGVSADRSVYENVKAPVHIVSGAGGNSEGHESYLTSQKPNWRVKVDDTHWGISTIRVSATKLQWKFLNSANGNVLDSFTMIKN